MARTVFHLWGIDRSGDFGEIVFNLVEARLMSKTDNDTRADFQNVYDLDERSSAIMPFRSTRTPSCTTIGPSAIWRSERMQRSQVWLILTAVLFVAWLGYLGYWVLALRREAAEGGGQPIILSRPQFLVASLVVSAEVAGKDQQPLTAKVLEVYWPSNEETRKLVGQSIKVDNLGESEGLSGAGTYLLPLLSRRRWLSGDTDAALAGISSVRRQARRTRAAASTPVCPPPSGNSNRFRRNCTYRSAISRNGTGS